MFVSVDFCFPDPCLNGATCVTSDTFECVCADGYEGRNCESNINDCLGGPCQNGGTCDDLLNDFSCKCTSYFFGKLCEKGEFAVAINLKLC